MGFNAIVSMNARVKSGIHMNMSIFADIMHVYAVIWKSFSICSTMVRRNPSEWCNTSICQRRVSTGLCHWSLQEHVAKQIPSTGNAVFMGHWPMPFEVYWEVTMFWPRARSSETPTMNFSASESTVPANALPIRLSSRLFEQGLYSDVTFVVDERTFPLHRCVLAARSSFFQEAFENRWHGRQEIKLPNARVNLSPGRWQWDRHLSSW